MGVAAAALLPVCSLLHHVWHVTRLLCVSGSLLLGGHVNYRLILIPTIVDAFFLMGID